jgi:hypothetical protein
VYITFLGYHVLPFLRGTVVFLYPAGLVVVLLLVCMLTNFNLTSFMLRFYFA